MIETLLQNLDTLLLVLFGVCALIGAALMIVLRQPMRVAMALTGATRIADIKPDILSR